MEENIFDSILIRIRPFEMERRKVLAILIFREIIVLAALLFLIKCFIICINGNDASIWFLAMILGAIYYSYYDITHTNKLFKKDIKSKVIYILQDFFNFRYISKSYVSKSQFTCSNLFPYFEDVNVDDCLGGCYNSVDYSILETKLSGKSRRGCDITVFKGLVILFDFNKKILKDAIIARKKDDSIKQNIHGLNIKRIFIPITLIWLVVTVPFIYMAFFGNNIDLGLFCCELFFIPLVFCFLILGVPFLILHIIQQRKIKMEKTEMEDVVFNKDYIIHTKDPVEARYLITTSFIERYLKLQQMFKTKNVKCSFWGKNKLMFAIPTRKDLFEICSLFTSLENKKYIEKFSEDLEEVKKIIDVFKLNERTGL